MKHNDWTRAPLVASALAVAAGLGACAPAAEDAQDTTVTTATTTASTTAAPTTETTTAAPEAPSHVAATTEEVETPGAFSLDRAQQAPSPAAELVIADVRAAAHDGFDRVVFEYSGAGAPGFIADYTAQPLQQASGYPIEVAGTAYLEVMIQGTPMGMLSPREELNSAGPMNIAAESVQGVTHGGVFEADTQYFIGLDQQRPFHAYTLADPPRVVVDIQK